MAIGHVRTREFKLNLNAPYTIRIEVQKNHPIRYSQLSTRYGDATLVIYGAGRVPRPPIGSESLLGTDERRTGCVDE